MKGWGKLGAMLLIMAGMFLFSCFTAATSVAQSTHSYYLMWYDNVTTGISDQITVTGNNYSVYIGGALMGSYSSSQTLSYPGVMGGPVRIASSGGVSTKSISTFPNDDGI